MAWMHRSGKRTEISWVRHRYRRRPLRLGAAAILACIILGPPLLFVLPEGGIRGQVGVLGLGATFAVVRWSRRRALASVPDLTAVDPRPPVVYLRSFAADRLSIPVVPTRHPTPFDTFIPWHVNLEAPLEEIVAEALWRYGPVLAAAEPGAPSPPLGAARAQLDPDAWQQTLLQWMARAQLITVAVGRGPGLMWELARATELGLANRVLFVIPPPQRRPITTGWRRLDAVARREYEKRQQLQSDWRELCDALDRDGAMWLPRDIDLVRTRVVLPGCPGRSRAQIFAARRRGDFSYEAAVSVAVNSILADVNASGQPWRSGSISPV
jgi:hypothetical protein